MGILSDEENKMPKGQKIQMGVILSAVGLILALAGNLVAHIKDQQSMRDDLNQAKQDIKDLKPKAERISVIENDVHHLTMGMEEVKGNIRILIERGK